MNTLKSVLLGRSVRATLFVAVFLLLAASMLHFPTKAAPSHLLIAAFVPNNTGFPTGGCKNGHTGTGTQGPCDFTFNVLPNVHGILDQLLAATIDSGDCAGAVCTPTFSYTTQDNRYVMYNAGYAITSISNSSGTSTAVMNGGVFEAGDWICISGASVADYNACWHLTSATWTVNLLTQVQWAQSGLPAAATGGNMILGCGANIPGYGAHPCRIEMVIQHMTGTGPNVGLPASGYPLKQAWANQACKLQTWVAGANHPINDCLWVASVGHFYHVTNLCATVGYCTSGGTVPGSWNVSGGTTSDGTITWQDDGTTNAFPLEAVTDTAAYPGIAGTPAAGVFNINSVTCGGPCSVAQVASGEQMIFEWPYLSWINQFNASVIAHYAAVSWSGVIDYMRLGGIGGGEWFPYASSDIQAKYGFNGSQMSNIYVNAGSVTMTSNQTAYISAGPSWEMMVSPNYYQGACTSGANCPIMPQGLDAVAMGLTGYKALGSQGLQAADITSWAANNTPYVSNYFIPATELYWPTAVWLEQQTLKDSVGPGATGCSTQQNATGNLSPLLAFAQAHHTNVFEVYTTDLLATYDPLYSPGVTMGSGCTPYPTGYGPQLTLIAQDLASSGGQTVSMGSTQTVGSISVGGTTAIGTPAGPPNYYGARRAAGHELDVVYLNIPAGMTGFPALTTPYGPSAATYCPGSTQSNAVGCLPNLGGAVGAGNIITDGFGQRIVRLTDSVSDPKKPTTQFWIDKQGNSDQANAVSIDDKFVCIGRGGSGLNFIFGFDPVNFAPGPILFPGATSAGAWGFNWCTASRLTAGLYFDMTQSPVDYPATGADHDGVLYSFNAATDPNANVAGGLPTPTVIADFTTNSCFNNARFRGAVPFFPVNATQSIVSIDDVSIGFAMAAVRNGCFDPVRGVIDWQPATHYTASLCGAVTCGTKVGTNHFASITPMDGNLGGWTFQIQTTTGGTSGGSAPTWCQTAGCTVNDNGITWVAIDTQNNWGAASSGHITNSCASQGFGTLAVAYHIHNGTGSDTEVAGDCDVYDLAQGYGYHNGTKASSPMDMSGPGYSASNNPFLFTAHAGAGTISSQWLILTPTTCVGTLLGGLGTPCNSTFMNNTANWKINTTQVGGTIGLGHGANGVNNVVGSTTSPIFAEQTMAGSTNYAYFLPKGATGPGCPPSNLNLTCYANGTYVLLPEQHASWAANGGAMPVDGPFVVNFANPLTGTNGYDKPFTDPMVGEIDVYQTDGTYNFPIRECQTQSSENGPFSGRYHTMSWAQSGKYVFFTSDGMNQFGATTGNGCGPDWKPSTSYSIGTSIVPLLNNAPANVNVNGCVFQVLTAGTSGATAPNWASAGAACNGPNITDNTVVWKPGGNHSCRTDILACELK